MEMSGEITQSKKSGIGTYLLKKLKKVCLTAAIIIAVGIVLRLFVVQCCVAASDAALPSIPRGSLIFINKTAGSFETGDVIIYKEKEKLMLGIVKKSETDGEILISRHNGKEEKHIQKDAITGKAFFFCSTVKYYGGSEDCGSR